ncbi:cytochrome c oxidase subunit 3 [Marinimicrobium sp. C2-29]|uniref:cytochrome c oxidase subunit 3 n=1 Tax=Marinimicrobium sp. C2-29 TaxID=3139825 RepID=UPI003139DD3E
MATSEGTYYVPEQSKLPLWASFGLFLTVWGAANWLNGNSSGPYVFMAGGLVFAVVLWNWFGAVINENMAGLNNAQLKRSYVWGMSWFIFSEFMFFAAFFGALFYVRNLALPWLSGEGNNAATNEYLWKGFEAAWPLMTTPDMAVNGADATVTGPDQNMSFSEISSIWTWLPFWNTVILLTSSVTVHMAHSAIKNNARRAFNNWLGGTIVLAIVFLFLQVYEYYEAYAHMGLTLDSGIYGTTFFMLTGFHGMHVFLGTFMLAVMWFRSVLKGHFNSEDQFGFEAASWYWHFVDVVWVGLFFAVYIFG